MALNGLRMVAVSSDGDSAGYPDGLHMPTHQPAQNVMFRCGAANEDRHNRRDRVLHEPI